MALPPVQRPVFLARRSYRQRRLRDTAKVLPIAGAILWFLPVLSAAPQTGATGLYLLGVWLVLILLAAGIAAKLHDVPEDPSTDVTRP